MSVKLMRTECTSRREGYSSVRLHTVTQSKIVSKANELSGYYEATIGNKLHRARLSVKLTSASAWANVRAGGKNALQHD